MLGLGAALALSGCAIHGLALVRDERVRIVEPDDRAAVTLPLTVVWEIQGAVSVPSFAVFVDRPPPPPGRTPGWLFRGADDCAGVPGCPDADYLARRNVFLTGDTTFTVERVEPDTGGATRRFHEVTVVLLDDEGRRAGESAWSVQFTVADPS